MAKNSMLLYGKNSVLERLKVNPHSIQKVFLQYNFDNHQIEKLLKNNRLPVEHLKAQKLERLKPAKDLQGVVARVDPFEYCTLEDFWDNSRKEKLTIIFLDRINDPHNLGVIIRTAACFGNFAVVIPEFKSCEVNETVLHVASGGENYVSIAKISNLSHGLITAKENGYWIAGTMVNEDSHDITKLSLTFPLGIVMGSEGEGIRYGLEKHIDIKMYIPMPGAKLSFNVSMASAICCYEAARQRNTKA